jgi:hypothetical protein
MPNPLKAELSALRSMIQQARDNLSEIELPEGRGTRCKELLDAAFSLANDLVRSDLPGKAAAHIGAKGGKTTAKRMAEKDRLRQNRNFTAGLVALSLAMIIASLTLSLPYEPPLAIFFALVGIFVVFEMKIREHKSASGRSTAN